MFNPVHNKSENDFDAKSGKYFLEIFIKFENREYSYKSCMLGEVLF
jgi:hypothetical protein